MSRIPLKYKKKPLLVTITESVLEEYKATLLERDEFVSNHIEKLILADLKKFNGFKPHDN